MLVFYVIISQSGQKNILTENKPNCTNNFLKVELFIDSDNKILSKDKQTYIEFNNLILQSFNGKSDLFKECSTLGKCIKTLYQKQKDKHKNNIVFHFNYIRHNLHNGNSTDIKSIIEIMEGIVSSDINHWSISESDIMPWDYYSQFFNYRGYFELIVKKHSKKITENIFKTESIKYIYSSIYAYLSCYTGELIHFKKAYNLDKTFNYFKLNYSQALIYHNKSKDDLLLSLNLLQELTCDSLYIKDLLKLYYILKNRNIHVDDEIANNIKLLNNLDNCKEQINFNTFNIPDIDLIKQIDKNELSINIIKNQKLNQNNWPYINAKINLHASYYVQIDKKYDGKNVLLIPCEWANWANAKQWAYTGHFAFEEGLIANNINCEVIPGYGGLEISDSRNWLNYLDDLTNHKSYDQLWVWLPHIKLSPDFIFHIKQKESSACCCCFRIITAYGI